MVATRKTGGKFAEDKHPRAKDGTFGHGEGIHHEHKEEDAAGALKDKEFLTANADRLAQAADAARSSFPEHARSSDAARRAAETAVHDEAANIIAGREPGHEGHALNGALAYDAAKESGEVPSEEEHEQAQRDKPADDTSDDAEASADDTEVEDPEGDSVEPDDADPTSPDVERPGRPQWMIDLDAQQAEHQRYLATPEGQEEMRQQAEHRARQQQENAANAERELDAGTVRPVPREKLDAFSSLHDDTTHAVSELGDALHESRRDAAAAIGQLQQAAFDGDERASVTENLPLEVFPAAEVAVRSIHSDVGQGDVGADYEADMSTEHDERFDDTERDDPREDGPPEEPELEGTVTRAEEKEYKRDGYSDAEIQDIRDKVEAANKAALAEHAEQLADYNRRVKEFDDAKAFQEQEFRARAEKAQQALERLHALQSEAAAKIKELGRAHEKARDAAYSEADADSEELVNRDAFAGHDYDEEDGTYKDPEIEAANTRAFGAASHLKNTALHERDQLPSKADAFDDAHTSLRAETKGIERALKELSKITGRAPNIEGAAPKKPSAKRPAAKKPSKAKTKKSANRPDGGTGPTVKGMAAPRYKLKLSKLDYISGVDVPAQETARVLLIKRASSTRSPLKGYARVAKVDDGLGLVFCWAFTSTDASGSPYHDLQGDNIDGDGFLKAAADFMAGSRAVDDMHNSAQTGYVAFAMPMTPEIAKAFGVVTKTTGLMVALKPSPAALAKFKSGEYTGVSIAGTGIREPITKGAKPRRVVKLAPTVMTSEEVGHQHSLDLDAPVSYWSNQLSTSYQTAEGADDGHAHAWSYDEGTGEITIAMDSGHTHTVEEVVPAEVRAKAAARRARAEECPRCNAVCDDDARYCPSCGASMCGDGDGDADDAGGAGSSGGPTVLAISMRAPGGVSTPEGVASSVDKNKEHNVADNDKMIALEKRAARFEKMSTLTDAQRLHFGKLSGTEADTFLNKSAHERDAVLAEIEKANEVVYESKLTGEKYRKNDDHRLIEMAKRDDARETEFQKEREARKEAEFAKKGDEVLSHFSKGAKLNLRARIMKALNAEFVDAAEYQEAVEAMKGANALFVDATKARGYTPTGGAEDKNPAAQLNNLAKRHAAENKVSFNKAYDAVLNTPEGRDLYAAMDARA